MTGKEIGVMPNQQRKNLMLELLSKYADSECQLIRESPDGDQADAFYGLQFRLSEYRRQIERLTEPLNDWISVTTPPPLREGYGNSEKVEIWDSYHKVVRLERFHYNGDNDKGFPMGTSASHWRHVRPGPDSEQPAPPKSDLSGLAGRVEAGGD